MSKKVQNKSKNSEAQKDSYYTANSKKLEKMLKDYQDFCKKYFGETTPFNAYTKEINKKLSNNNNESMRKKAFKKTNDFNIFDFVEKDDFDFTPKQNADIVFDKSELSLQEQFRLGKNKNNKNDFINRVKRIYKMKHQKDEKEEEKINIQANIENVEQNIENIENVDANKVNIPLEQENIVIKSNNDDVVDEYANEFKEASPSDEDEYNDFS